MSITSRVRSILSSGGRTRPWLILSDPSYHSPRFFSNLTKPATSYSLNPSPSIYASAIRHSFPAFSASVLHNVRYNSSIAVPTSSPASSAPNVTDIASTASNIDVSAVSDTTNAIVQHSETIVNTAMKLGDLKAVGLASNWTPVGWIQQLMELVHVTAGLPWWATIIGATIVIRGALFPIWVKLMRNSVAMANIQPEMQKYQTQMKAAQLKGDMQGMQMAALKLKEVLEKNDVSILKGFGLPLLQMPIFVSFFIGLRNISEAGLPSLKAGGVAWFPDLTVPDPIGVLPVLSAATFFASIELGSELGASNPQQSQMKNFMRVLSLAMIPIAMKFDSAVLLYWVTSNIITVSQASLLRSPSIRSYFKIPQARPQPDVVTQLTGAPRQMGFWEGFNTALEAGKKIAEEQKKQDSLLQKEKEGSSLLKPRMGKK